MVVEIVSEGLYMRNGLGSFLGKEMAGIENYRGPSVPYSVI